MNIKELLLAVVVFIPFADAVPASMVFQNLDFEEANLPEIPPSQGGFIPVDQGLPRWTAYAGNFVQTSMAHNTVSIGGSVPSILGSQWPSSDILEGRYSLLLQPMTGGPRINCAIAQMGTINPAFQSLQLFGRFNSLEVSFDGEVLPLNLIGTEPNYGIYAVDVSRFAGRTGDLKFTSYTLDIGFGYALIDAIQFSPLPIPEPSTYALLGLGGLLLGLGRWRSSQRK